jgi:hypothetical protein
MKYTIQKFGDALRIKTTEKSLSLLKSIEFSFCFYDCLDSFLELMLSLNLGNYTYCHDYIISLRKRALKQSIFYYPEINYSFCFFYTIDEIKEFLAEQNLNEQQLFILKNWM